MQYYDIPSNRVHNKTSIKGIKSIQKVYVTSRKL